MTVAVTADGGSGTDPDTTGRGQTAPQALACANAVVEGGLTAVRPTGRGRIRVTMSVDRWLEPSTGPATARFDLADPAVADPAEAYATGDHLLLLVPQRKGQIPDTYQGQELKPMRDRITRTLPEAAHTTCPRNSVERQPQSGDLPRTVPTSRAPDPGKRAAPVTL
ncbi:hypothetical protein ACPEIC_10380 [Stenotrophomonas sp. NPDC087984]